MDFNAGFPCDSETKTRVDELESKLLKLADLVICSSQALADSARWNAAHRRVDVVRNGLDDSWLVHARESTDRAAGQLVNAWYFGTIASWIDWTVIEHALKKLSQLHIHMAGPVESRPPFTHPRLHIYGAVHHSELPRLTRDADFFILPFLLNDLVRHVNPVKVYEYLALNRPVIAVDYTETRNFLPWISLYSTPDEFVALLGSEARSNYAIEPDHVEQKFRFLASNTWSSRVDEICDLLHSLDSD
jgi:glycosyltransferase involved in cell wall biosynthesis